MHFKDIEMERGEEIVYPRQHEGTVRQVLWGAFWGTLIMAALAVST